MAIIVQAVAEGNILPGEGEALTAMLGSLGKALDFLNLNDALRLWKAVRRLEMKLVARLQGSKRV